MILILSSRAFAFDDEHDTAIMPSNIDIIQMNDCFVYFCSSNAILALEMTEFNLYIAKYVSLWRWRQI